MSRLLLASPVSGSVVVRSTVRARSRRAVWSTSVTTSQSVPAVRYRVPVRSSQRELPSGACAAPVSVLEKA